MELSGRDSLSIASWGLDDELPLMEGDSDLFNHSLVSSGPILDHDDVNALFPMLSDSSFEYEGDQQLLADDPDGLPFESDLSPILAPKTAPLATRHEAASAARHVFAPKQRTPTASVTVHTPRSRSEKDASTKKTSDRSTSASRKQRKALTPVKNTIVKTPEPHSSSSSSFSTPVRNEQPLAQSHSSSTGAAKRRRSSLTSSSTSGVPVMSANWTEQEQSAFFSMFKNKWPNDESSSTRATAGTAAAAGTVTSKTTRSPGFSTMLLQRFDAISKKVRSKTVIEVRLFYTIVLSSIAALLQELENDIDLTNPDEVRIAVWCWSKLLTDESHKKDFQNIATVDPSVKKRLAHVLLQSIIRSRRQMLKAKCTPGFLYNSVLPSVPAPASELSLSSQQQQPKRRQNITHSSLFSTLTGASAKAALAAKAAAAAAAVSSAMEQPAVVHHPMQSVPVVSDSAAVKSTLKRKRSIDLTSEAEIMIDETPLKTRRQQLVSMEASFVSPAPTTGLSQQQQAQREHHRITSQTPPQSSRKKISIKMRIVPMDKAAKAHVVSSGCNPKVELKLTSTKRISEVAQHMAKKWESARASVPADAVLQFYEKQQQEAADGGSGDGASAGGWSAKDRSVTCFDIWKRCGKKIKNENVVVVYYAWKALGQQLGAVGGGGSAAGAAALRKLSGSDKSEGDSDELDIARSPGSLFAEEISLADLGGNAALAGSSSSASAASSSGTASLARGLQQFGESMAFHSSEFSDAALWEDDADNVSSKKQKRAACPLDALLDENDDEDDGFGAAFVDCSPNTQQQRLRRRITPVLVSKEEFDL